MSFKKRLLIFIGIPSGVCLILAIALFFLGSGIVRHTDQIKKLRSDLDFRLQATESLALLRQDFAQAQTYLPNLESVLPNRNQLVGFSRDLGIIAKQNQIDLNSSLGGETPSGTKGLEEINFTMTGQGSFDNFINFLKSVRNSRYLIKFQGLDFTRQGGNFKALLTGQIFIL